MGEMFNTGEKVIKRNETDPQAYGEVMDRENTPAFQKPGYIAVYFNRMVWIKPENIMHYAEWQAKHNQPQPQNVKNFWIR